MSRLKKYRFRQVTAFVIAIVALMWPVQLVVAPAWADAALYTDGARGQKWGWAIDYPSIGHAMERAKRECGENCDLVLSFRSGCGAWAADQTEYSTAHGWGHAETRERAEELANSYCRKYGGPTARCLTRVWGCNSIEKSSRAKVGRASRRVFVRLRLDLEEREPDGVHLHRRVRFCGHTDMSYEEEMTYSEQMGEVTDSKQVTGRPIIAPHFVSSGVSGWQTSDEGRMSASPVMQRFLGLVRQSPYYEERTSDTPFDIGDDNGKYDGVIIAFKEMSEYSTLYDIHCASEVRDWPSVHKDAVDLGRF